MLELQGHISNPPNDFKVFAAAKISNNSLNVEFEIISNSLNTSENFNQDNFDNWGLWDFDVVEVFVQKRDEENHYLEIQVSPLNQKFALYIKEPRKEYEKIINLDSQVEAKITDDGFTAHFNIPFTDIPGNGPELYGNFHACLSMNEKRYYFALKVNSEEKADFHLPKNFQFLGELNE